MKKNKLLVYLMLLITLFYVGGSKVFAFPTTITNIKDQGVAINDSGKAALALKFGSLDNANNTAVYCTEFPKTTPAFKSELVYTQTNWASNELENKKIAAGIGAIIQKVGTVTIVGESDSDPNASREYYYGELAINEFLYNYNGCSVCDIDTTGFPEIYTTYYNAAVSAYNDYDKTVTLSSTNLTFTKNNEYYISDPITVTPSNAEVSYTVTSSSGEVIKNGDTFFIQIPVSSVKLGETLTVTATVNAKKTIAVAKQYVTTDSAYQKITPGVTEPQVYESKNDISGTINVDLTSIQIAKKDSNDKFVSGAKLMFQTKDQKENNLQGVIITSTETYHVIENLGAGTYYLSEIESPKGYDKSKEIHEIVIGEDGTISIDGKSNDTNIVIVTNDLTETVISKISAVDSKELPGATLQILNDKKEKMSCVILDKDGKKTELKECTWVSGEKPVKVVGLSKGKYYLVETIAPEGYVLNESSVEFEVKGDGTVTQVEMKNELEIEVPDTLSSRSALLIAISMFDIALGIGILTYVKKNKIEE